MIELYRAALEVQDFFRDREWRFALIGGVVVARWGEPRATRDVDISLLVELGKERDHIDAITGESGIAEQLETLRDRTRRE